MAVAEMYCVGTLYQASQTGRTNVSVQISFHHCSDDAMCWKGRNGRHASKDLWTHHVD